MFLSQNMNLKAKSYNSKKGSEHELHVSEPFYLLGKQQNYLSTPTSSFTTLTISIT